MHIHTGVLRGGLAPGTLVPPHSLCPVDRSSALRAKCCLQPIQINMGREARGNERKK